jgi:hypothetical protein
MSDLETNAKSVLDAARELAGDLGKLGKSWIRYGLAVGESSMQASAHTLDELAEALRKVGERLRADG